MPMSSRERLFAYVEGRPVDRVPFVIQWGPWAETSRLWKRQGMKRDRDWYDLFGFDTFNIDAGVNFVLCPAFPFTDVEDLGDKRVYRDEQGVLRRGYKAETSMDEFLDYPVKDRKTWDAHKERFNPASPERFPADWPARAKALKASPEVVAVGFYPYGFLGGPRTMMGAEQCLEMMVEDPVLVEDINDTMCHLWYTLLDRILDETRIDMIAGWEDMAGKNGSLISPAMFRRFITPRYTKILTMAKRRGVRIASMDSDGLMHQLTPLFRECGFNLVYPNEVQAGNDLATMLKLYPDIVLGGHIDKRAMARNEAAMDAEIERIRGLLPQGRFLPYFDHVTPPDVPWDNYCYMVRRWKELVGKAG
ncbi:MAG: uroporphyrinogen decarboxylase family protein [Candidatus Coatesbacteria bacterium]